MYRTRCMGQEELLIVLPRTQRRCAMLRGQLAECMQNRSRLDVLLSSSSYSRAFWPRNEADQLWHWSLVLLTTALCARASRSTTHSPSWARLTSASMWHKQLLRMTAVVLALHAYATGRTQAAFTESFVTTPNTPEGVVPNLWVQKGVIWAGGRDAKCDCVSNTTEKSNMRLDYLTPVLQTNLLKWDSTVLSFYYMFKTSPCLVFQVAGSNNGKDWTLLWTRDQNVTRNQYAQAIVSIPVSPEQPSYAVKWSVTPAVGCMSAVYVDDIVFPAVNPANNGTGSTSAAAAATPVTAAAVLLAAVLPVLWLML